MAEDKKRGPAVPLSRESGDSMLQGEKGPLHTGRFYRTPEGGRLAEPEYFDLQSFQSVRECIARALWSTVNKEMTVAEGNFVVAAAKAAGVTLARENKANNEAAEILRGLSVPMVPDSRGQGSDEEEDREGDPANAH